MALHPGPAVRVRVHLGERELHHERPRYLVLLERLRLARLSGATVLHGLAGFGRTSAADGQHLLRLSDDLPIVVEVVEQEPRQQEILTVVREVAPDALVTVEPVRVL